MLKGCWIGIDYSTDAIRFDSNVSRSPIALSTVLNKVFCIWE